MSGVDSALQHDLCEDNNYSYYKFNANLNKLFYLVTIPVIIFASISYTFNVFIPLVMQITSLLISSISLVMIKNKSNINNLQKIKKDTKDFKLNSKYVVYMCSLLCVFATIGAITNFQNSAIPILVSNLNHKIWISAPILSALIFTIGNIFSAFGLGKIVSSKIISTNNTSSFWVINISIIVAVTLLSSANIFCIIIGFTIISLFKGIYRSFYSSLLFEFLPSKSFKARYWSLISMFCLVFVSIFTFIFANIFKTIWMQQRSWLILFIVVIMFNVIVVQKLKKISWIVEENHQNNSYKNIVKKL